MRQLYAFCPSEQTDRYENKHPSGLRQSLGTAFRSAMRGIDVDSSAKRNQPHLFLQSDDSHSYIEWLLPDGLPEASGQRQTRVIDTDERVELEHVRQFMHTEKQAEPGSQSG